MVRFRTTQSFLEQEKKCSKETWPYEELNGENKIYTCENRKLGLTESQRKKNIRKPYEGEPHVRFDEGNLFQFSKRPAQLDCNNIK